MLGAGVAINQEAAQKMQAQTACADQHYNALCGEAKPATLADQMQRRINRQNEEVSTLHRAQDILRRHPEFEELAWLLRSGLV